MLRDWLYGECEIVAERGFDELFLSECRKRNIEFRQIKFDDDKLKLRIKFFDKKSFVECAEKSSVNIIRINSKGLPELFLKYRRRYGIPVGLFLSCIIVFLLSSVLWSIEIDGNQIISEEVISTVLADAGAKTGVFLDCIDNSELEFMLYETFDEISWVSVDVAGSRMFVNIRETEEIEPESKENIFSNIIASKDGEIIRADVFVGEGSIPPGSAVVKGDLLVNGVITFRDGRVVFTDADAKIWARTKNVIKTGSALKISVKIPEKNYNRYFVTFFGFKLPWTTGTDNYSISRYLFDAMTIVFPIGLERKFYCKLKDNVKELSSSQALLIAFNDYAAEVSELSDNAEILEKSENIIVNDEIGFEGIFVCKENIAQKKIFTVEETDKESSAVN